MAEDSWHACEVTSAGPAEDGTIFIMLKQLNGQFEGAYKATPKIKQQMLATALAAMGTQRRVTVLLADTKEYSVIKRLYIEKKGV